MKFENEHYCYNKYCLRNDFRQPKWSSMALRFFNPMQHVGSNRLRFLVSYMTGSVFRTSYSPVAFLGMYYGQFDFVSFTSFLYYNFQLLIINKRCERQYSDGLPE